MKYKKRIVSVTLLIILLSLLFFVDKNIYYNLELVKDDINENIYTVSNDEEISIVSWEYQNDISKLIYNKKNDMIYTVNKPLLILNPYGTNITGLYIYFYTLSKYRVEYTISVNDKDIPNFTSTLSGGLKRKHEGQIIGLVQGMKNTITLRLIDKNNNIKGEYIYIADILDYGTNSIKKIDSNIIDDNKILDGLYMTVNVISESNYLPVSFYDKYGVLRAEFTRDSGNNTYRLINIKDKIFYAIDSNKFVLANRFGKIERIYHVDLQSNHDYIYSDDNNSILYIAGTSYIKKLDLNSGEDTVLIELNKLMDSFYETSLNYYKKNNSIIDLESFNWVHPNSVDIVNSNDIIISLRETSSIIYVANVYTKPEIKYIIAPDRIYEGTEYEKYLLKQEGDFSIHAGQHTVVLERNSSLDDDSYYLYMFNNNYAKSDTVNNYDWVNTISDVGTKNKNADNSMYYKYLVDEKLRTFTLVDSFNIEYSNTKSSVQIDKDNHYIITISSNNTIYEYNKDKKILLELKLDDYSDIYRTYKLDMKNFWFDEKYQYTMNENNNTNTVIDNNKEDNNSDFYYNKKTNTILGINSSNGNSSESDIIYYDNIYFTMYDYHSNTLIIPNEINGVKIKKITGINYLNVRKIIISSGIEEIGDYAFLGCKNLEEIVLPDTLKKIGKYSFVLSNKIKVMNIPDSVTDIGREAFKGWNNNQQINIKKNIVDYSSGWNVNTNAKINEGVK